MLPRRADPFVGRSDALRQVRALVKTQPLTTIVGAGGVGKTRLALALACEVSRDFPGGVWFYDLASDSAPVPVLLAARLGIPEDVLAAALGDRRRLLVLDTGEHADAVDRLLLPGGKLRVLVTSRKALGIPGEHIYRLEPLPRADAIRLFTVRAAEYSPDFALSAGEEVMVGEICARLDDLPLAVEMAACRVRVQSLRELFTHVDERLDLLTQPSRTAAARHRDLRALTEWTYHRMSADEQAMLRRISVFEGGFSATAASTVSGLSPVLLANLEAWSLLARDGESFRLPRSIRFVAREKLDDSGDTDETHDRLVTWLADVVSSLRCSVHPSTATWAVINREATQLRVGFEWAIKHADPRAFDLANALTYWHKEHHTPSEGRAIIERVTRTLRLTTAERAVLLRREAWLAALEAEHDAALDAAQEALRLAEDDLARAKALLVLGFVRRLRNEFDEAAACYREWEALDERSPRCPDRSITFPFLAWVAIQNGDLAQARAVLAEAASFADPRAFPRAHANVVRIEGMLALADGRIDFAADRFSRALEACPGDLMVEAFSFEALALVAAERGDDERAVRLAAAAATAVAAAGTAAVAPAPGWRSQVGRAVRAARHRLGPAAARAAANAGGRLSPGEAAEYALTGRWRGAGGSAPLPLSERELQVADLVAEGLDNTQIARRLEISKRTVEVHLLRIRNKLSVQGRAAIAEWVARRELSAGR